MINNLMRQVTNGLLERAMSDSGKDKFLIDGFPRNDENRAAFEKDTGEEPAFVLYFECPEAVMESRLLGLNQGRTDDNIESIKKRFKVGTAGNTPMSPCRAPTPYHASCGSLENVAVEPTSSTYCRTEGTLPCLAPDATLGPIWPELSEGDSQQPHLHRIQTMAPIAY